MTKPPAPAFNTASDSTMSINGWDDKIWHNDQGKLHRLDGPAVEYSNSKKEWWVEGKLHRLDGPAIERPSGDNEWWINGKKLTAEEIKLQRHRLANAAHKKRIAHLDRLMGARRKRQP